MGAEWKVPYKIFSHDSGWLVFKFESEEHRQHVLSGGPYSIYGRTLMLTMLLKCFEFDKNVFRFISVWIRLPGLPLDLWNSKSLSAIALAVGKPIVTDMLTRQRERVSFARVLVEVPTPEKLVHSV
ncbi:hypothetical protein PHJA_002254700 [Phtheirospermum japonicum]|uniref:DUF4283 domain-containing protein n=1 Tax=Phtheirospermum japonicum TaxID=374723 RepID=A0A830CKB8_9LAMI|nr:hypothetical protein PHJA_002254700 [Phtheirospermum japonicum]